MTERGHEKSHGCGGGRRLWRRGGVEEAAHGRPLGFPPNFMIQKISRNQKCKQISHFAGKLKQRRQAFANIEIWKTSFQGSPNSDVI